MRLGRLATLLVLVIPPRATPLAAQVSPGPLARVHRELEGTLRCTRCHGGGSGKDAMKERCQACHQDVAWLAERGRGLHGSGPVRGQRCAACHPDHAGSEFELVKWPGGRRERFEHAAAGWPLEQSHARIECEKCHNAGSRVSPAAALAVGGKSRWTGLEQRCGGCHRDVHRGALGDECATCHDAGRWAETPGFDHDSTAYPLTGRHVEVGCDACHLAPRLGLRRDTAGRAIPVYRPVPHATCGACHRDVHEGRLGGGCATCHTTQDFARIGGEGFDHARTGYPLRGRHAAVRCSACHPDFSSEPGRRPEAGTCGACHQDPHGGSATLAGRPADCGSCHSEAGFAPSSYPRQRHQVSRYPLEGEHAPVKCGACHRKDQSPVGAVKWGAARVILRPPSARCLDCHGDDHGGQLSGRAGGAECGGCHRVEGWAPSSFDRAAHAALRVSLEGRHGQVECRACHGADRTGLRPLPGVALGRAGFAFRVEVECAACHLDPHRGRFEPRGLRPADRGCQTCHGFGSFAPTTVDVEAHQRFRFPLAGAHRATPCAGCHRELAAPRPAQATATLVGAGGRFPERRFEAPSACGECHQSVHGEQFEARPDGGRCDACHGDDGFIPAARFDHDRDAGFKLEGGHQRVACGACHPAVPGAAGGTRLVYRPLSAKCEACHARGQPGRSEQDGVPMKRR
jgi:hypothetical protein